MPAAVERALRCPSAQPGMTDVQVLGVANGTPDAPRIAYLNETLPASAEVLAAAAPVPATQVLRLAAKCEEHRCTHFDGHKCQLAMRIVGMLDAVTDALPPCVIRKTCRWYTQEGRAACLRCPQILTDISMHDENLARVAGVSSTITLTEDDKRRTGAANGDVGTWPNALASSHHASSVSGGSAEVK